MWDFSESSGLMIQFKSSDVPDRLFQLVLPEYLIHFFFCVMFFCAAEWLTLFLNLPLLAYHVWRCVKTVPLRCPAPCSL